jgi:hypothetical protein
LFGGGFRGFKTSDRDGAANGSRVSREGGLQPLGLAHRSVGRGVGIEAIQERSPLGAGAIDRLACVREVKSGSAGCQAA